MSDLVPPEVPIKSDMKKQGFFKKLFSKKNKVSIDPNPMATAVSIPDFVDQENITLPESPDIKVGDELPSLPPITQEKNLEKIKKSLGKGKGKKVKLESQSSYQQFDLRKSFDWSKPIAEQDNIVKDSSRNNLDVAALIEEAKRQISSQESISNSSSALSTSDDIPPLNIEIPGIAETHTEMNQQIGGEAAVENENIIPEMPSINLAEHKEFEKIDKEHEKLRIQLDKKINAKTEFQKIGFRQLLKQYDDRIEKKIEQKELELSDKRNKLEGFQNVLKKKEHELKQLHEHIKGIDAKLKAKEFKLNDIIRDSVNKQLSKRTGKDRSLLKSEIQKTISLNKRLTQKLNILEKDRIAFDKKKQKLINIERDKLNSAQEIYDRKLRELDVERKEFEDKRLKSIDLLNKGEILAKELSEVHEIRTSIDKDRKILKKELHEDKELKKAISGAEIRLKQEHENLSKTIFSKYIESSLGNVKPGFGVNEPTSVDFNMAYEGDGIYSSIKDCKAMIMQGDISNAKKIYNAIKKSFESSKFSVIERKMLYNNIRALYNEIELASIEQKS